MTPRSRDDVLAGLKEAQSTWTAYAAVLPLKTFFSEPAGGGWAPVTHLRHLTLTAALRRVFACHDRRCA